jgi:hypothetical protein
MNFISKIPKSLLVAISATVGFALTDLLVIIPYANHLAGMPPRSGLPAYLLMLSLSGIASAIVVWIGMRQTHKNAWAIAIITGFAMLAFFPVLRILIGTIPGYVALLPITWGLLVANSRMLLGNKRSVLRFCALFILCIALWLAGNKLVNWMLAMRAY